MLHIDVFFGGNHTCVPKTGQPHYRFVITICRIMPAEGAARDWENIVGFPAGGDERGNVTPWVPLHAARYTKQGNNPILRITGW